MTQDEKDALAELMTVLPEDLAQDVITHRRNVKAKLTLRAAKALVKQYRLTGNPETAAEHHLNMAWRGFSADWMKKPTGGYRDYHNPSPVQSANYGNPDTTPAPPQPLSDEEKRRRAEQAERARRLIGGTASGMKIH